MTDLPRGWEWATLGDIARVASDLRSPEDHPDLPHIAPNHIEPRTGRLLPYRSVSEDGVTSPKHRFYAGQILYSKIRPYLAKAAIAPVGGLCSADMYPITTDLHAPYVLRWLLSDEFTQLTMPHQGRSLLPKINAKALLGLPIPVPPLAEQQRIALEVDSLTESSLQGERCLADAKVRLRGLRSAIERKIIAGQSRVPFRKIVRETRYGTSVRCSYDPTGGIPVLRIPNVASGVVDPSDLKYAPATELTNMADLVLTERDVLVVRTNGSRDLIGRSAITLGASGMAYASYLIRCRVDEKQAIPEWANYILSTAEVREQIEDRAASSAGQYNLSAGKLLDLNVPLPSLSEQRELLEKIEENSLSLTHAETTVRQVDERLSHLRGALHSAACEGRLVPQDSTDEPASALLERIRAERAGAAPARAARRRPSRSPTR